MSHHDHALVENLAASERRRDAQWKKHRSRSERQRVWRAHQVRRLTRLLPGQTVLELGGGEGWFARQLHRVTRGENPITCATFAARPRPIGLPGLVEYVAGPAVLHALAERQFDVVTAWGLLDGDSGLPLIQRAFDMLRPGGSIVFFQANPWGPVAGTRRWLQPPWSARRSVPNRAQLYEALSEIGFIRAFANYYDFTHLGRPRRWLAGWCWLSPLLENAPGVQKLAESIVIHAQKPARDAVRPAANLCEHDALRSAISVVVPCHNEEMNVRPLVEQLRRHYDGYLHEIVLVDDNSRDGTKEVIQRLASEDHRIKPVFRRGAPGVGGALADGYRATTGKYVLSMDCDFEHLLPELRDLFAAAADGYDVVVGSRFWTRTVVRNYPFGKLLANRGFHLLAQLLLRRRFHDLTNNLKLMRREVVSRLDLRQPGFAVNAETGLQPLLLNLSVKEVPISWINRTPSMGASSFRLLRVGGGYWQVLWGLWLASALGWGPYDRLEPTQGTRSRRWQSWGGRACATGNILNKT